MIVLVDHIDITLLLFGENGKGRHRNTKIVCYIRKLSIEVNERSNSSVTGMVYLNELLQYSAQVDNYYYANKNVLFVS